MVYVRGVARKGCRKQLADLHRAACWHVFARLFCQSWPKDKESLPVRPVKFTLLCITLICITLLCITLLLDHYSALHHSALHHSDLHHSTTPLLCITRPLLCFALLCFASLSTRPQSTRPLLPCVSHITPLIQSYRGTHPPTITQQSHTHIYAHTHHHSAVHHCST